MTSIDIRRLRYNQHKASAKSRGIEFDLTFDEWWAIWAEHFNQRGRRSHEMNMCRTRDEGGYSVGNVRIDTSASNQAEKRQTMLRRDINREWPNGGHDWLISGGSCTQDYFKQRIKIELAIERGEVVDDFD